MILASCLRGRLQGERVTRGEKRSKSNIFPPFQLISVNSPRGRTEKTWLLLAGSNQNDTNNTNQIPRLSNVRVRQTNNDCAHTYFSLHSPLSILGPSSFSSACNHFWLALTLCQYHHHDGDRTAFLGCLLQALTRNWPKNSRNGYLGGIGFLRIVRNLAIK